MEKKKKISIAIMSVLLLLSLASCEKKKEGNVNFSFNAYTEKIESDTTQGAKVHLVEERYIGWEQGDEISIGSNMTTAGNEQNLAWLLYTSTVQENNDWANYNGVFMTSLPDGSEYFLGLYPSSSRNIIKGTEGSSTFSTIKIDLPETQTYRDDYTFDRKIFPMVAWYGGRWTESPYTPFNLDFNSLAGVIRIQVFNSGSETKTLESIIVECTDKQLCGLFTVNGYNTNNPTLTGAENTPDKHRLVLSCGGQEFAPNKLCTFYLVLPSTTGRDLSETYNLNITVKNTAGQTCGGRLQTKMRRNSISYPAALAIGDSWTTGSVGLPGNGTEERPFRVYTIDDLNYLKSCYNSTERRINGQEITANTYIRIMRGDIVLTTANWTDNGIQNFIGHMDYYANNSSTSGITNNSQKPLFENIIEGGIVTGINIRCDYNGNTGLYTPFCQENRGKIIEGKIYTGTAVNGGLYSSTSYIEQGVAGICANNYGEIIACGSTAVMNCPNGGAAGGICFNNYGTIRQCYAASEMSAHAANAGGICYKNNTNGQIIDCYFASRITVNNGTNWGGIVYINEGEIYHCYTSASGSLQVNNIAAGIAAKQQQGGKINHCRNNAQIKGARIGGIVEEMTGGIITNCYYDDPMNSIPSDNNTTSTVYSGGMVGKMSEGKITNSYVYLSSAGRSGANGAFVGKMEGGLIANCYAYELWGVSTKFYGEKTSAAQLSRGSEACYLLVGSQAGITALTDESTLLTTLNANKTSHNANELLASEPTYDAWESNTADDPALPFLESYRTDPGRERGSRKK